MLKNHNLIFEAKHLALLLLFVSFQQPYAALDFELSFSDGTNHRNLVFVSCRFI